jgi:hypothetical protein
MSKLKLQRQWTGIVAGTRKTTPGFRLVEKAAMLGASAGFPLRALHCAMETLMDVFPARRGGCSRRV